MQITTYILENHVHILKDFIQLKYYTVNCPHHACVCVGVCTCVCTCICFQNSNNSQLLNGQNHRVCMEMPMITC